MHLERIEVSNFRGIRRLSLTFDELTTLIGENTWGKSSLLDALTIMLPPSRELYQLTRKDFHVDVAESQPLARHCQIVLCFASIDEKERQAGRYRRIKPLWCRGPDDQHRIYYRLSATQQPNGSITTRYDFLDNQGRIKVLTKSEVFAQELMGLHPVLRLTDARRLPKEIKQQQAELSGNTRFEKRLENTCRRLMATPGHVNKGEIRASMQAMSALVEHYFSFKSSSSFRSASARGAVFRLPEAQGQSLSEIVKETKNPHTHLLFLRLMNTYLQAKGPHPLRRCARPIVIIDDPEGRLHPTHLARAWSLLNRLPMQKILTTNSSDLISAVPLASIRRLVRQQERTVARTMPTKGLSSDELRRIGFHLRFHRPGALFARCWLLVEGETEVWLFSEFARQLQYNLPAEGIQIVEFAQSGLRSMINVAQAFGIEWHVITDGDGAGKKYAHSVRSMLHHETPAHRLTELSERDIEHFLYMNGFESFFRDLVRIPTNHTISPPKVVTKVLKKFAKPDLALAIVSHTHQQGEHFIPTLIKVTLSRVVLMARAHL
ncbi:DUF2813 domain-containing protein [Vibrio zhugei]|uniref:DUF2813 domain-containing protein n=1 Tax=Vibrio zhugei TaxID=2479546 RepID=A0ABV7CDU1_9VIBR|nr:DUF2813 domain-containing protein [Vibrio zhugei]